MNCDQGYHQDNSSGPATCYAGVWTTQPTCEEDPCLANPNGIMFMNHTESSLVCSNVTSGSSCNITCDDKYTVREPTMTCIRGEWFGNATCFASSCDDVPPIEHIDSTASASCVNTESRASCNISCLEGYTAALTKSTEATSIQAHCYKGIWSGSGESLDLPPYDLLRVDEVCTTVTRTLTSISSISACANLAKDSWNTQYFSYNEISQVCQIYDNAGCQSWTQEPGSNSYMTYFPEELPFCSPICEGSPNILNIQDTSSSSVTNPPRDCSDMYVFFFFFLTFLFIHAQ